MLRMTIEIDNGRRRIVFYKEGGYYLEEYIHGIGWCLNSWDTVDLQTHLNEASAVLARIVEKVVPNEVP